MSADAPRQVLDSRILDKMIEFYEGEASRSNEGSVLDGQDSTGREAGPSMLSTFRDLKVTCEMALWWQELPFHPEPQDLTETENYQDLVSRIKLPFHILGLTYYMQVRVQAEATSDNARI